MAAPQLFYELSHEADSDLEAIFDYTAEEFGVDQAATCLKHFEVVFGRLIDNPMLGRERAEIRLGLRSIPKGNHVVFYRIVNDRILIVRILHASRDLPRVFEQG